MDRQNIGKIGEHYAQQYLIDRGYMIIAINQQFNQNKKKLGEIDIIASLNNITYLFEVKTRKSNTFGPASEAITNNKLKTLYNITEFLASSYSCIKLQLIAIEMTNNKPQIQIIDLH